MLELFIRNCLENEGKDAFVFKHANKLIHKTYHDLYIDLNKIITILKDNGLKPKDKILLFILPSYDFYVTFLACIYYGLNVVVIDSFKDKEKVQSTLEQMKVTKVLVNNKSKLLTFILNGKHEYINVSNYINTAFRKHEYNKVDSYVLTTFTSGTTSLPKPINRTLSDLEGQVSLIKNNVDISFCDVVLCGLPIYTLFLLLNQKTVVLSKRVDIKMIEKTKVDSILMPIEKVLKNKDIITSVDYMFLGGAILYNKEVEHILYCFPNTFIEYVYGSSEGVLISKTKLKDYINHKFTDDIKGMNVELVDKDSNGVGQIKITSNNMVGGSKSHLTGDLAYFDNGLCIVGRKKYSKEGIYNYLLDEELLEENKKVNKGFSFVYNDKIYFAYEGKLNQKRKDIIYLKYRKLPMDSKHKTKLNYQKVIKSIK